MKISIPSAQSRVTSDVLKDDEILLYVYIYSLSCHFYRYCERFNEYLNFYFLSEQQWRRSEETPAPHMRRHLTRPQHKRPRAYGSHWLWTRFAGLPALWLAVLYCNLLFLIKIIWLFFLLIVSVNMCHNPGRLHIHLFDFYATLDSFFIVMFFGLDWIERWLCMW